MDSQNVTLSLPKELLYRAKRVALERHTSLSGLLLQALTEIVEQEENYAVARERHLAHLRAATDLGTGGQAKWQREDLHDRPAGS
jgi:hypothetical protein